MFTMQHSRSYDYICTLDGSNTEQNAITSNTCDAVTLKNISRELGDTGQIRLNVFLPEIEHCIDWNNFMELWKQAKIRKKLQTEKRGKRCFYALIPNGEH